MALLVPPSLFLRRAPRGLSTSLDLLPLSMIYILFCLLLFITVFITSSSVHLTALRVFLPSQSARYRASSLPLLHLEGNERSGGAFSKLLISLSMLSHSFHHRPAIDLWVEVVFRYIITWAHYVWCVSSTVRLVSFFDLMSSGLLLVMRSASHFIL